MILRFATPLALVALALGVFAPSAAATDEVADWNQILVSAPTANRTSQRNSGRSGQTVTFWNAAGIETILATPLGPRAAPLGSRAMAMMHVAMADAVTSIRPKYKPYVIRIRGHRKANKIAAVASAARGVLLRLFPERQAQLDAALAESLTQVPDGEEKDRGIALGDQVAAHIVALRANDGSGDSAPYTPPVGLGFWQPDPRTGASPFLSWASVTPWTMRSATQFSPEPPPPIFGHLFAQDLAELKAIGGTTSSVRTAAQECIARFATDNPVAQYNRLARIVAEAVPSNLEHNTRAFAVFSLALADAFISSFEAKFAYHFWRPWTAIQNAAAIGAPELQDLTWLSLIPTPPHPEYPANHAVQSGAVVSVLKHFYGPNIPPVTLTCEGASCRPDICPAAVTAGHLDDFKELFGLARIYGGIHYRNTIVVSWAQGEAIAQNVIDNFYVRRGHHDDDHDDEDDENKQ
jgi:PAP2 superfamily